MVFFKQVANRYIAEFRDESEIAHTVAGLWNVFDEIDGCEAGTLEPERALDFMVQTLVKSGVGLEITRDGCSLACLLAGAILQKTSGCCESINEPDGDGRLMHWYHEVDSESLKDAAYGFVEEFKRLGYREGDNNYVALRFIKDRVVGDHGNLDYIMGDFFISPTQGEFGKAVFEAFTEFAAGIAWL